MAGGSTQRSREGGSQRGLRRGDCLNGASNREGMAGVEETGVPHASSRKSVLVSAEFDLPPETRCPAAMTRKTSGGGNARSRTNAFQFCPDGVDVSVHHVPNNPVAWLGVGFLAVGAWLVHISRDWNEAGSPQPS